MATYIKTIEYFLPKLPTLADNTLTNFTQSVLELPESDKVFKSVIAELTTSDTISATGGTVGNKFISLSVGGAATSSYTNTQVITHTGETISFLYTADFTSHFSSNYTGSSHTIDCAISIDQTTGTNPGWVESVVKLVITYEYNSSSTTRIKTVYYPLDSTLSYLNTSKPGTAVATIPSFDTKFPEADKTFKQITLVIYGQIGLSISTNVTLRTEVDTLGEKNSQTFQNGLSTDRIFTFIEDWTNYFTTNSTHNFYMWCTETTAFSHVQAYMVINYTYNETDTTSVYNSILLPMTIEGPIGFTTTSDYTRNVIDFMIQEPGNIVTDVICFMFYYIRSTGSCILYCRIGSGSFQSYIEGTAGFINGIKGLMVRKDDAFTLVRGKNILNFDIASSSNAGSSIVASASGYWIIGYISDKASGGTEVHNTTIKYNLLAMNSSGYNSVNTVNKFTPNIFNIPHNKYYINSYGVVFKGMLGANINGTSILVQVERLTSDAESYHNYLNVSFNRNTLSDGEITAYTLIGTANNIFKKYIEEPDNNKIIHTTGSRAWTILNYNSQYIQSLEIWVNYHGFYYTLQGSISGSDGGIINLYLHDSTTGNLLNSTSSIGNSTYSLTWYDNTSNVFIKAYENNTKKGISIDDIVTGSFGINLSGNNTGGTRYYVG